VAAVKLVAAVGEEHHHALGAQAAGQERDERARGAIGPVHVFEDQHRRLRLPKEVQQLQHRFEQAQLRRGIVALGYLHLVVQTGYQRRQLRPAALAQLVEDWVAGADQRPQCAQQGRVGKLGIALLDGFAPEDDRIVGVALLELPYQPGFADARLTAEQHQRRTLLLGVAQDRLELRQFADATYEVTAGQPAAHDGSIAIARSSGEILAELGPLHG
jgi:hypothetical protein